MASVLVELHFAALVTGDAALAARCIHPSHVNHMAADEPPACAAPGVPGFVATSAWLRLAFGDLSFEIIGLTADAEWSGLTGLPELARLWYVVSSGAIEGERRGRPSLVSQWGFGLR